MRTRRRSIVEDVDVEKNVFGALTCCPDSRPAGALGLSLLRRRTLSQPQLSHVRPFDSFTHSRPSGTSAAICLAGLTIHLALFGTELIVLEHQAPS